MRVTRIVVALTLGTLVAVLVACDQEVRESGGPMLEGPPPPARVVFVGLDGLDWGLLDRCIADGACPTFARMQSEGAWAELRSQEPYLSPLIWTTIATGRPPEVHGVLDFVVTDPATGDDVPISNRFREVPAFWNVLSANGRTVNVVNWWATHPAEDVSGVMVSERPFYQLFGLGSTGVPEAAVSPADVLPEIRARVVNVDRIGWDEVRPYVAMERDDYEARVDRADATGNPYDDRVMHLRKILATTRGVFAVSEWLLENRPVDLTAFYVEGTDTVGHRFAHFMDPPLDWVDPEEQRAFSEVMPRYYAEVDRLLGELMRGASDDLTWIVAADHGFHTGAARPAIAPDDFTSGAARWHRSVGVLLASGPTIRPGRLPSAHIHDLCRTLLWLAGVPISDGLEGTELVELVRPEWAAANPPVRIASYADMPRPWKQRRSQADAVDAARLAELEALGYVVREGPPPDDVFEAEEKVTALFNRGKLAESRGDLEEAARWFEAAVGEDPGFFWGMLELYGVHREVGNHQVALYWIARAMQTEDPRLPERIPVGFVREAIAADRLDGAMEVVLQMPASWQERSSYHAALGMAAAARGWNAPARTSFERALDLNPADLDALDGLLRLVVAGVAVDWRPRVDAAYGAVRTDLGRLRSLGLLLARLDQHAGAERCLREVLESDPSDVEALQQLARSLRAQDRMPEAVTVVERLLELDPGSEATWLAYADALDGAGRDADAAAARQRAEEQRPEQ
jgi:tetratricopeptide (TPR) repeat protein